MKKLTRKLFVSLMTLVLTAMALGTSTFAWFSMNTTATAEDMEVTAKSNAVFLLIGNTNSAGTIQTAATTTISAAYTTTGNDAKTVFPVAYYKTAGTLGSTSTQANKWYTAGNTELDDSATAANIINVSEVPEGDADYMLTYKVYLTLSKDSSDVTDRLIQVTPTINENTNVTVESGKQKITSPVSCVVVIGSEKLNFASTTDAQTTSSAVTLSSQSCVEVTIYVYINGNDSAVMSKNLIDGHKLTGSISLQFDLVKQQQQGNG